MRNVASIVLRELILKILFFLPRARRRRVERWLRGRDEFRKLRQADCVIVSYGKAGRTWLRAMLSRYYQTRHGLDKWRLIGFDNLHRQNSAIPRIFFTHDNYIKDYTGNRDNKADFYDKKVVLLARSPADTAVSQYFHWRYRMRDAKKNLNAYPVDDDTPMFDFVMRPASGMPNIIDYMNAWDREAEKVGRLLVVRYEDLRAKPEETLARIVAFIDGEAAVEQIAEAVSFGSFENLKALEAKKGIWILGSRLAARDRSNPNSFKVRRAKVGGYRDYFDDREVAEIESFIDSRLAASFGYGSGPELDKSANG